MTTEIRIKQGENILAEHNTDSPLSHYGQAVWIVQEENPDAGPAEITITPDGGEPRTMPIEVIGVFDGWLVVRQQDGYLCGIIWSDGSYYAEVIEQDGEPVQDWEEDCFEQGGYTVRGTIAGFESSKLGAMMPGF